MLTYLDTNVWSDLLTASQAELRKRLRVAVENGIIVPVVSLSVLDELTGLCQKDRRVYRAVLKFIESVVGRRVLRPLSELHELEIWNGCALPEAERYLDGRMRRAVWPNARSPAFAREVAAEVREKTKEFKVAEERRRADVREMMPTDKRERRQGLQKWWAENEFHIEDWIRDHFRKCSDRYGLPADEQRWPDPRGLPLLWNSFAFYLARIWFTVGENRTIKPSDLYDFEHYAFSAYADLLVTSDGPFGKICELAGRKDLTIEDLDAFATRLQSYTAL